MADDIEYALSVLMDQLRDTPMTTEVIRRETIQFILDNVEDVTRAEVEDAYDLIYPQVNHGQKVWLR